MSTSTRFTGRLSLPTPDSGYGFMLDVRDEQQQAVPAYQGKIGIFVRRVEIGKCVGKSRDEIWSARNQRFAFIISDKPGEHAGKPEASDLRR